MFKLTVLDNDKWIAEGIAYYFAEKHILTCIPETIKSTDIIKVVGGSDVVISELAAYGRDVQYFLEMLIDIREKLPATRLILLTDIEAPAIIGYVNKLMPDVTILSKRSQIHVLANIVFSRDGKVDLTAEKVPISQHANFLTSREFSLLRPLASGHSLVKIANVLNISGKTVSHHRRKIIKKLNCRNMMELTHVLVDMGFSIQNTSTPTQQL
jgi:DNA-binding NarL/FixJ family response regulator